MKTTMQPTLQSHKNAIMLSQSMDDAKAVMLQEKLPYYCSTNKAILRPAAQCRATRTPSLKSVKFKTDPDLPCRKDIFQATCNKRVKPDK